MRGATICNIRHFLFLGIFQPTRPLRGATFPLLFVSFCYSYFNPRAPCGARRSQTAYLPSHQGISTHAPLAGRDRELNELSRTVIDFNPRAPCGARLMVIPLLSISVVISTHAPLAGRDRSYQRQKQNKQEFQPTRPLRGATAPSVLPSGAGTDFNPRAPCGARQQKCTNHYAHFCDNRQISDAFAQNAACQGILLLFDAGKPCGFWVRTAQVISARLCFAL